MNHRVFLFLLVLAALLLCAAPFVNAQSPTSATITGTVVDPQGAVVPQATVTAHNLATGVDYRTETTSAGLYRIPNLPPGNYDVTAKKQGFTASLARGIHVDVGDVRDLNLKMAMAGATTEITVTSQAPMVETTRTDVSSTVTAEQMRDLPVTTNLAFNSVTSPSNDYMNLATTAPGVKFDTTGQWADAIGPGFGTTRGTIVNVDGSDIMDKEVTARNVLGASLDEVRQFQVLTNNYNAEYGEAGGMIVNVITKSGSNSFHGDGHAYFRGRNLEASNAFYNLGIISDVDQTSGLSNAGTDFGCRNVTQGVVPAGGSAVRNLDGCRRAPFQKNEWGFTAGGPFIKDRTFWFGSFEKTHQQVPTTLAPPTGVVTVSAPFNEYMYSAKLDHKLTNNNQISARWNQTHQLASNQITQTSPNATPDNLTGTEVHDHNLMGSMTSTINPRLVNEARVTWHRIHDVFPDQSDKVGISFANFDTGANFCCPQHSFSNRYQGVDNLTWTHGTHTIKTGVSVVYAPFDSSFQQFHFGQYSSSASPTSLNFAGLTADTFTWGVGPSLNFPSADGAVVTYKDNVYGAYIQDTWKMRPSFTVNYGLRYDVEYGAFSGGTVRKPGGGCFQGNGIIPACSHDYNNFQPRIGFAWSPGFDNWLFGGPNKTVISASFAEVTELAFMNVVLDSRVFDGVDFLTLTGVCGVDIDCSAFPNAPPNATLKAFAQSKVSSGFFGRVRPISPNLKNPEIRHINFSIRRELTPTTAVELDYIGVFGFGLFGEDDKNFPALVGDPAAPGFFLPLDNGSLATGCPAGFSCRPDARFLAKRTNENSRTSHYNGFSAGVTRRLASHVQFQLNYTWSKLLTSGQDFFGLSEPAFPHNFRPELGPDANDVRHLFNYSLVFDTGKLVSGGLAPLANNWGLAFTGSVQSGRPYPISTGVSALSTSFFPGLGNETQQRPNVCPNALVPACAGAPAGTLSVLNIADFTGSLPSTGPAGDFQFISGNVGHYAGRGSGSAQLDVSLSRGFQLGHNEQRKLILKADAFNILNHTNFLGYNANDVMSALPIGVAGCTNCIDPTSGFMIGRDGRALNIRDMQHGRVNSNLLLPNWGSSLAGLGDPSVANIPRQIQLAVKITW